MYAIFFIVAAAAAAIGGSTAVLTQSQDAERGGGDVGALAATFTAYARSAQGYANSNGGASPDNLDQFRFDPSLALATRAWGGRAKAFASSATWSLQPDTTAPPTARDVCVEISGVKSRGALVTVIAALPRGAYASGSACGPVPAPGSVPSIFPATAAFRLRAIP